MLALKGKVLSVAFLLVIEAVGFGQLTAQGAAAGVAQTFGAANSTTTTTLSASPGAATGAGDLLVAVIKIRNTTALAKVSGVADSASNAWSKAAGVTQGTQADMEVWYTGNAASVTSVTVTVSGASALAFTVLDVTGALTAPLDKTATLAGTGTAASTNTTATTAQASEIAVGAVGWNGTATPSGQTAGYTTTAIQKSTATGAASGEQASWEILSATGTQTYGATLSASVAWTGAIATFKLGASAPAPTITSFSPTSGPVGTPVVITGTGFTNASAVKFNGTTATYTVTNDTSISTSVPAGATTGTIQVTTPAGTATSPSAFIVNAATTPHIMLIVMENREYGSIIGSSNAPYINSLANTYRSATKWYAVQHNSPHDYVQLLAGSDLGFPNGTPYSATTVVDELHTKGTPIPWQAYMESMPSNCFGGTTADGLYDTIHNPFRYFTNYNSTKSGGWCNSTNLSTEGVLPYPGSTALVSTLNGPNAPAFVWITPNDCNNMHGDTKTGSTCASSTTNQLTKAGDTWLSSNLGLVISSQWFSQNGIIIITWDEGTTKLGCCGLTAPGGHIVTIVVSSKNKGLGKFTSNGDHYGTLAAIENAYGLTPLLGNSAFPIHGDLSGAFG